MLLIPDRELRYPAMQLRVMLRKVLPTPLRLLLRAWRNRLLGFAWYGHGFRYAKGWSEPGRPLDDRQLVALEQDNRLWTYFQQHRDGPGIWKWEHYFAVYDRHCCKFVGRHPKVVEIGVFSGGSLGMWSDYFGRCEIYGVDIEEACQVYERPGVRIFIGDQADRDFWARFTDEVPEIDLVIDDGGHTPRQQRVTLECLLPHLSRGGVYVCEDVAGIHNLFATFATGFVGELNRHLEEGAGGVTPCPLQFGNFSLHFYPFMVVIERSEVPLTRLYAPKHGSQWQPFLDRHLPAPAADTRS
jgi:hypothetical protein